MPCSGMTAKSFRLFVSLPRSVIRPVRRNSLNNSTNPEPHSHSGEVLPINFVLTVPSGRIVTPSMAPSRAGMPQEMAPPSNAGPAGVQLNGIRLSKVLLTGKQ